MLHGYYLLTLSRMGVSNVFKLGDYRVSKGLFLVGSMQGADYVVPKRNFLDSGDTDVQGVLLLHVGDSEEQLWIDNYFAQTNGQTTNYQNETGIDLSDEFVRIAKKSVRDLLLYGSSAIGGCAFFAISDWKK